MFRWVLFLSIGAAILSCGKDDDDDSSSPACNSTITGNWSGVDNDDSLILGTDEAFSYTGDDECTTSGNYACPGDVTEGTLTVTIDVASASDYCLPAGDYTCPFSYSENVLSFYCTGDNGTGAVRTYTK